MPLLINLIIPLIGALNILQGYALCGTLAGLRAGNRTANRYLALLIFLLTNNVLAHCLIFASGGLGDLFDSDRLRYFNLSASEPLTFFITANMAAFAPLSLQYSRILTETPARKGPAFWIQFIPFLCIVSLAAFSASIDFGFSISSGEPPNPVVVGVDVFIVTELILAFRKLSVFPERFKDYHVVIKEANLNWLRFILLIITLVIGFFSTCELILRQVANIWLPVVGIIGILFVIYGFLNPGTFPGVSLVPAINLGKQAWQNRKYARSTLSPERAHDLENRINRVMEDRKPYLDPELSLIDLAATLDTTPHLLSQVLNEKMKLNFYDYVNLYRLEEAKRSLLDPGTREEKILTIAMNSGFSSVSTFNAAFKKCTGVTPSEFRKNATEPIV